MAQSGLVRTFAGRSQRGSILFFTLVVMLLLFLGAAYTLRGAITDSGLTDSFSERQKNIATSDLATQMIASLIATTAAVQPLEISAASQPWFINPGVGNFIQPTPSYWATCMAGADASHKCHQLSGLPSSISQTVWFFVQPTGQSDASACQAQTSSQSFIALYYDVWVHTIDARGRAPADVESVYKLCVSNGGNS